MLTLAVIALSMSATAVKHRKMYGYFLNNSALPGYGYSEFYMDDLLNANLVFPYSNSVGIFAGACANNVFYACEYVFNQYGPQASDFIAYDLVSGKKTVIGPWTTESDVSLKLQDMTYDYTTQTMYAVGFQYGVSALYTVNLETAELTKVANLSTICGTIAANKKGELYAIGTNGKLYLVNKNDGAMAEICDTQRKGMLSNQSMEFDLSNGKLYWAACTNSNPENDERNTYLIEMDLSKNPVEMENLGQVGVYSALLSLYIPFVEGGDNAPAAPTALTVEADQDGKLSATLRWKNPTTTFSGDELTAISTVTIVRNGLPIATIDAAAPGAEMSYTDSSIEKDGAFRYSIYCSSAEGEGEHGNIFTYVGHDYPAQVTGMKAQVGEGCSSITLSWEAPQAGFNNGFFSTEGLSYKIVRMPDETVVAEGLTGNSYTDQSLRRLGRYTYMVYACNAYGETAAAMPGSYVLGKALDIPVEQDFGDLTYFTNQWQATDANNDGFTWTYYSPYGYYQFGNTLVCVEYILNPTIGVAEEDANEWIITPPLNFEADKTYQVRVTARSISDEVLDVTLGSTNEVAKQVKVDRLIISPTKGEPMPTTDYIAQLPAGTDGVRCVGLHLCSDLPFDGYSYIQIAAINIEEAGETGISDIHASRGALLRNGHLIVLPEGCDAATLYNMSGQEVMQTAANQLSTETLPSGIYLLQTTLNGKKQSYKIQVGS